MLTILHARDLDKPVVTVTILGAKDVDTARVKQVLTYVFTHNTEWDHGLPNVELIFEEKS